MRRPFLLAGIASIVLMASCATSAAAHRDATAATEVTVAATFHQDGFKVALQADSEDRELQLAITKGGQFAVYDVPAKVDRRSLEADLGALGSLDLQFEPGDEPPTDCSTFRAPIPRRLTGTFDFTGERGYIEIDRPSIKGAVELAPNPACGDEEPRRARASRVGADDEPEATLRASTRVEGAKRGRYFYAVGLRNGSKTEASVFGGLFERRGKMIVQRGAEATGGAGLFRWSFEQGTATVSPPAPFTGSADFLRRPGEPALIRGSLHVPILGGDPVPLTGSAFTSVSFHPELFD